MYAYLWYKDYEEAGHGGSDHHQHCQGIRWINEQMLRQHQTQWGSNTHHNDHNVHGNADESRVVDEVVLDVATFIGKEESEHHQETLVDIQRSNEIVEIVTLTLLVHFQCIFVVILSEN